MLTRKQQTPLPLSLASNGSSPIQDIDNAPESPVEDPSAGAPRGDASSSTTTSTTSPRMSSAAPRGLAFLAHGRFATGVSRWWAGWLSIFGMRGSQGGYLGR